MKNALRLIVLFAAMTTPLWAAKKGSVTIRQDVSVGSTHIAAGQYKVSFDRSGPNVKVTLTKSGGAPIVLEARLQPGEKCAPYVTLDTRNGATVLKEIELDGALLVLEKPDGATQ